MSLRRVEAEQRARCIEVLSTHINLDVTGTDGFTSTTTLRFRATGPTSFVDCHGIISDGTLNGEPVDLTGHDGRRLPLSGLAPENTLIVRSRHQFSHDGEGLHEHIDVDGARYLYAMSFLDAAPAWFTCFDQPDLKTPCSMRVWCPPEWTVWGNREFTRESWVRPMSPGRLGGAGDHGSTADRPAVWTMKWTEPISPYLITLVAGEYVSHIEEHDGIVLGVHARRSLARELEEQAADILTVTRQSFDAYHQLFELRYPFGQYHQAFVPEFNAGAMENPGCVTLRDEYLFRGDATATDLATRACTIAHEMAHQWFGDLVTMRWWDDLWLNESFAEFMGHLICDRHTNHEVWVSFGMVRKLWGATEDQGPSTHPVAGNDAADAAGALANFDGISYAKGAGILNQLLAFIGEDTFFEGLRIYFNRHAFANATFADLVAAWREAGAVGIDDWVQAWLTTSGMDRLTATGSTIDRTPGPDGSVRPHAVTAVSLASDGSVLGNQDLTINAAQTPVDLPAGLHVPDAHDQAWAEIRPSRPADEWPVISWVSDALTRVVLWNSLRGQVRAAEVSSSTALQVSLVSLDSEPDTTIMGSVAHWAARELAGYLAPRAERETRMAEVAEVLARVVWDRGSSSDHQLAALRRWLPITDRADLLHDWLAGRAAPRELDTELRWAAVQRLAMLDPDTAAIEAESQRDRGSFGVRHRDQARASRPVHSAKAEAFAAIVEPSDLPATRVYAIADAMFLPGQETVTDEFAHEWFDRIAATAEFRSGWPLARVALRSFPLANASPELLRRCAALAAGPDCPPALQRPLRDGAELMRRALAQFEL